MLTPPLPCLALPVCLSSLLSSFLWRMLLVVVVVDRLGHLFRHANSLSLSLLLAPAPPPYLGFAVQKLMKKNVIKAEPFEIEPSMINLFSYMSLVMITFPFAPLSLIFMPLAFYMKVGMVPLSFLPLTAG